jgi:hypothetical protein
VFRVPPAEIAGLMLQGAGVRAVARDASALGTAGRFQPFGRDSERMTARSLPPLPDWRPDPHRNVM